MLRATLISNNFIYGERGRHVSTKFLRDKGDPAWIKGWTMVRVGGRSSREQMYKSRHEIFFECEKLSRADAKNEVTSD